MGDAHLFMFIFDVAFVCYVIGSLSHMKAQLARDREALKLDREATQVFLTQTLPSLLTDTITAATRPLAESNERIAQMVRDLHR